MSKETAPSTTSEEKLKALSEAFEMFNLSTSKLEESHGKLEEQARHLSIELEQKNAELEGKVLELNETREYLDNILQSITDGVIAIDMGGNITRVNKTALELTGHGSESLLSSPIHWVFSDTSLFYFDDFGKFQININSSGVETQVQCREKEKVPVVLFASSICNQNQQILGTVLTFRDLTIIKKLENEIDRASRLASVGEMAAGVAHEIRNPLGGVEMFASMLDRDLANDPKKKDMVENILIGVRTIKSIVSGLLTFTRSFNNTCFREMDLVEVVESALLFSRNEIEEKEIQVIRKYDASKEMSIHGDIDQLKQVFLNLLLNATCAVEPKKGTLEVAISQHDSEVEVIVKDNGEGIEREVLEKIFDPFFTTKSKGNGLGLAISYRIIEAHKGHIQVESERHIGTEFKVRFPSV